MYLRIEKQILEITFPSQTLKQNTEPAGCSGTGEDGQRFGDYRKKESVSTQTQTPSAIRAAARFNHHENANSATTLVSSNIVFLIYVQGVHQVQKKISEIFRPF